jgi:hypothetical protein
MIKEQFIGNIVPARILDRRSTRSHAPRCTITRDKARRIAVRLRLLAVRVNSAALNNGGGSCLSIHRFRGIVLVRENS